MLFCALTLLAFAYARAEPSREVGDRMGDRVRAGAGHPLLRRRGRRTARRVAAVRAAACGARSAIGVGIVALCGLALIPLALSQNSTGHDNWIANSPLRLRLAQIIPQFLIGTGAPARKALKFAAIATALAAIVLLLIRGRDIRAARGAARRRSGARRLHPQPCVHRRRQRCADHAQHHRAVAAGRDLVGGGLGGDPSTRARGRADGRAVCDRPDGGDRRRGRL